MKVIKTALISNWLICQNYLVKIALTDIIISHILFHSEQEIRSTDNLQYDV